MPIYEFECKKCGKTSSFFEKVDEKRRWFNRRKCEHCGSKKLSRVLSSFSASFSRTETETMNELANMGNVNFVPQAPGQGAPPPGGCPYANSHSLDDSGAN